MIEQIVQFTPTPSSCTLVVIRQSWWSHDKLLISFDSSITAFLRCLHQFDLFMASQFVSVMPVAMNDSCFCRVVLMTCLMSRHWQQLLDFIGPSCPDLRHFEYHFDCILSCCCFIDSSNWGYSRVCYGRQSLLWWHWRLNYAFDPRCLIVWNVGVIAYQCFDHCHTYYSSGVHSN